MGGAALEACGPSNGRTDLTNDHHHILVCDQAPDQIIPLVILWRLSLTKNRTSDASRPKVGRGHASVIVMASHRTTVRRWAMA